MTVRICNRRRGFTLVELLTALLILSLLSLMSFRGLTAVLEARDHVARETEKWRNVSAFLSRFERDIDLAAPRPAHVGGDFAPPWLGHAAAGPGERLQLSRFASREGTDVPRRIAYSLNADQQIELSLWPGPDAGGDTPPARYPVLSGVADFELQHLDGQRQWVGAWPSSPTDNALPRAVRLRLVLASGEQIVRVFAVQP